jgi:hypothetical protein
VDTEGYVVKDEFKKNYVQFYIDESLHELTDKAIDECIPAANNRAKGEDVFADLSILILLLNVTLKGIFVFKLYNPLATLRRLLA